jgi:hypothetical protein
MIVHWSEPARDLWLVFWEEADSLSISDFKAISLMVNQSLWVWNIKKIRTSDDRIIRCINRRVKNTAKVVYKGYDKLHLHDNFVSNFNLCNRLIIPFKFKRYISKSALVGSSNYHQQFLTNTTYLP